MGLLLRWGQTQEREQGLSGRDTLGHLLALSVTAANEQDRAQVAELAEQVQQVTGDHIEIAFVDQGYTGEQAAEDGR